MAKKHSDKALTESQFQNGHTIKYIDDADSIARRESLLLETKTTDNQQVSSADQNNEKQQKFRPREQWRNKAEFMLTCIAFAVGLGNVWR